MKRAVVIVVDSFGIGATDDADKFGDVGSNTLGHIANACSLGQCDNDTRSGHLKLPHLERLGLGLAAQQACGELPAGFNATPDIIGAYGYAAELSSGKDTPSGHWEMAGVPVLFDWGYFSEKTNSFPAELLADIAARSGIATSLANCHASGTQVLDDYGEEHIRTGIPIFYTSADSVFQIACHEHYFGLDKLMALCEITRQALAPYNIGRVIARPFVGEQQGDFVRTGNRRDLSLPPPDTTVLEKIINERQGVVTSIGKIADIYAHVGITNKIKATGLKDLLDSTLQALNNAKDNTLVFTNLVDFDSSFGHRRDTTGYAGALEYLDGRLPEILSALGPEDILIICADHGCDPTWPGTDHTREHIPVLLYGEKVAAGFTGKSDTFADMGQTLAHFFATSAMKYGRSLLKQ
ncbi:phosphopentomutase [Motilimonas pumila]|uniref:Phosphopentomutase n=1 Tax=Motilimonas pumila TaxID=2303987 RepID=A0A418YD07_9GAMM|nr:phosphopentomutase [Motilimonas pumila]RJG42417.1 phosphopentomutase [Motilimonas pumila]